MDARRGLIDEFVIAAGVLTRFPLAVEAAEPGAIAASGWAFPLVGGGIGALCAVAFFVAGLLGLPARRGRAARGRRRSSGDRRAA